MKSTLWFKNQNPSLLPRNSTMSEFSANKRDLDWHFWEKSFVEAGFHRYSGKFGYIYMVESFSVKLQVLLLKLDKKRPPPKTISGKFLNSYYKTAGPSKWNNFSELNLVWVLAGFVWRYCWKQKLFH